MNGRRAAIVTMSIFLSASVYAANPFLNAQDNKPVSANFRGTEWNDENIQGEIPLSAQVITTRIAQMSWGAIFKIEFVDLKSRAKERREIGPQYFIATDERIVLLNEEDNDAAAKKISAMDEPPEIEQGYVRAIISGKLHFEDGPYTTTIDVKGNECTYLSSHDSGHYSKFVWKKGVGLVEHGGNYGAMKDGFRLTRDVKEITAVSISPQRRNYQL
jgi:hypothetical protein